VSAATTIAISTTNPTTSTTSTTSTRSTSGATTTTSLSGAPVLSTEPSTTTPDPRVDNRACGASSVYVIGDSLTVGAAFPGGLEQLLAHAGYHARVDAEVSRFIKAGVQILDFRAHVRRQPLEPVVMVALGTNDAHAGFTITALESLVDELMAAVGPNRSVVWVNTQFLPAFRSDTFNRVLRWKAAQYPNLVIADWDATDHTSSLTASGIHYTNDGYRVRAIFTLQQLEKVTRCTPAPRS
jgi:lysophospholipase L1-like esterase